MSVDQDPALSGTQQTDPAATGSTPTPPAAEKMLSQSEVSRIVAREVAKAKASADGLVRERDELSARVAEFEQRAREAEESKLTAAQRAELALKRTTEKLEGERDAARKAAEMERQQRHQLLKAHAAASHVGRISSRLFNPEIAPDLEALVMGALVVEADGASERVMLRVGNDPADVEPLSTEAFTKFADARLARYFATATGSGAPHGRGANGSKGPIVPPNASPQDKIRAGLEARGAKR